jgi:hypothetical protein
MYLHVCLHVCWHVCIRHTCTYALDTAFMSQDTYRYSQVGADTGICISHIHCAYVICIQLYPVHVCVHMCAVCTSQKCTYIKSYVCCMCFTYKHICPGRITDAGSPSCSETLWILASGKTVLQQLCSNSSRFETVHHLIYRRAGKN